MNFKKILTDPVHYLSLSLAVLRGSLYIVYYSIFKKNVRIGFPFIAYCSVKISGPGSVCIGGWCTVVENVFRGVTIVTLSEDAVVTIAGKGCLLGGLTIRCRNRIEIGNNVMTAVSLVQDSLFVNKMSSGCMDEKPDSIFNPEPIHIGDNVWLGGHCVILSGSNIGNDCVLSACSVCYHTKMKEYSLGSGNPIRRTFPIEQLLALRK